MAEKAEGESRAFRLIAVDRDACGGLSFSSAERNHRRPCALQTDVPGNRKKRAIVENGPAVRASVQALFLAVSRADPDLRLSR
jgi:hypothetical protein